MEGWCDSVCEMPSSLKRLRESVTAAHVLPLAVFMLLNLVPGWLRIENSELPWYQQAPEHWLYPAQTFFVGALLLFFAKHYRLAPWRGLDWALPLGVLGIAFWVAPVGLGWAERLDGFNPEILAQWPQWQLAAIVMRFVRMVVVVPLIEELFWRGFLMRYVRTGDGTWPQIPFGSHSWKVYGIVTLLVMLAHDPADYAVAFIWGSLVYFVAVRTKSLGACVLMHALANLLLGFYILETRHWGFW